MNNIGGCSSCGYPITAEHVGDRISCPYCQTGNIASGINQGTTQPVLIIGIALAAGILGIVIGRKR